MYDFLIAPFAEFAFMRRALVAALVLSISVAPIGVFLMLRRMSLTGDAISHAVLPGAAAGFLMFGLSIVPMTIGGLIFGLLVAVGAGAISRATIQKEDASLAALYLISLALGVVLLSLRGSSVDLLHVLFGNVLGVDNQSLVMIGITATVTLLTLALLWRAIVAECLDPQFLASVSGLGTLAHFAFLALVVLNLVAGFQGLGTLLAVGLMMLPAATSKFWTRSLERMCLIAAGVAAASSVAGLLASYHVGLASGPCIILAAGGAYVFSMVFAPRGLIRQRSRGHRHRTA